MKTKYRLNNRGTA